MWPNLFGGLGWGGVWGGGGLTPPPPPPSAVYQPQRSDEGCFVPMHDTNAGGPSGAWAPWRLPQTNKQHIKTNGRGAVVSGLTHKTWRAAAPHHRPPPPPLLQRPHDA